MSEVEQQVMDSIIISDDGDHTSEGPEANIIVVEPLTHDWTSNNLTAEEMMFDIEKLLRLFESVKFYSEEILRNTGDVCMDRVKDLKDIADDVNGKFLIMFFQQPVQWNHLQTYLNFTFTYGEYITVNRNSLTSIMHRKLHNPDLYSLVADYGFTSRSDATFARRYFKLGIFYYKFHKQLYLDYFKMEMNMIEKTNGNSILFAMQVYQINIEVFNNDLDLHTQLLAIAFRFKICSLHLFMLRDMVKKYNQYEIMWANLATLSYEGYFYNHNKVSLEYDGNSNYVKRITCSFQMYEEALQFGLDNEKLCNLWKRYSVHIVKAWEELHGTSQEVTAVLNTYMEKVFPYMHNTGILEIEHYVYWAEFSTNDCKQIILEKAIQCKSVHIWTAVMVHYLNLQLFEIANRVLRDSVLALREDSFPLWELIHNSYVKLNDSSWIENLYAIAIVSEYPIISTRFRILYLRWTFKNHSKLQTIKLFNTLKRLPPEDRKLYLEICKMLFEK